MLKWIKSFFVKKELEKLNERRALPMGRTEFKQWASRIIAIAQIPGATPESQEFTLANLLLHLGPTEDHKEDNFFVHSLRKFAVNQVADTIRVEIRDRVKTRLAEEEKQKSNSEVINTSDKKVLADGKLSAN